MQRFSDSKCFNAWVVSFDEHSIIVEVTALEALDVGDKFLFQISGMDSSAMFEGRLAKIDGLSLTCEVLSRVQVRPPYEEARVRTDLEGVVHNEGKVGEIRVEDVSVGGIGFVCGEPLTPWSTVHILVKTAYGGAQIEGQVRYCKPIEGDKWHFRVGLHAPSMKDSLPLFGIRCTKAADAA
jgi:hypothetical protein